MRRVVFGQLQDPFAQIGLYYPDTVLLEVGVELNLLGGHRLGLHCQLHAPLLGQPVYDAAGVFCVLGKVDHRAHLLGLSLELGHQLRQVV